MTVSLTTRLGLVRWSDDQDGWSREQFDGNMAQLEALTVIGSQGVAAARPAAATPRRLYLATDTERLHIDTGAEWLEVLLAGTANATDVAHTPTGTLSATTVAAALAELDTEKASTSDLADHIGDTTDALDAHIAASSAHAATTISYAGAAGLSATDVEGALDELDTEKANASDLTAHTGAASAAHAATAISYAGAAGLSAATVEAALDELDAEKASKASPQFTGAPTTTPAAATDEASAIALVNYVRDRLIAVGLLA